MTRYYYGYRAPSRVSGRSVAAVAVAGVVLYGAASASPVHAGHTAPASVATAPALTAAIPAASSYTPATWSRAFLLAAGYTATTCNMAFLLAWIHAEGSRWSWRNPLDDELPMPASRRVNTTSPGHGVMAYLRWADGLRASAFTLSGHDYPAIRAALRAGNDAQRGANAVAASPWGTEPFEVSC